MCHYIALELLKASLKSPNDDGDDDAAGGEGWRLFGIRSRPAFVLV